MRLDAFLNNAVLVFECVAVMHLLVLAFKIPLRSIRLLTLLQCAYLGIELTSKICYHYAPKALDSLNVIGNLIMILEVWIILLIYQDLLKNEMAKKLAWIVLILSTLSFTLAHFFVQPLQVGTPMHSYIPSSVLIMFFILYFLKEKLSITYQPNKVDNFWIYVSLAILFGYTTQLPSYLVYNFIMQHAKEISFDQLQKMSYIKYITSLCTYSLLIRSCYEFR